MDTEYLKKVGLYILTVLLSIGALFYFGYHLWHSLTKEVETMPVSKFTAENTAECDAYIFRNETPLYSDVSGKSTVSSVRTGEKVQIGSEVAKVYSESSPKTVAEIADVESRIELLESCGDSGTVSLKDSSKIEEDINTTLTQIRDASAAGDLKSAQNLRTVLLTLLNKRALLTGGAVINFKSEIDSLEAKKAQLSGSLGSCLTSVSANVGGYYFPEADGFEKIFSAAELDKLTYESVKKLLASSPESTGNCAGKIVTDSYWYAVCPLDKKYLETFRLDGDYTVKFTGNYDVTMEVYKILSGADGVIVVFRTNYMPEGFSYARMQKVRLVTDTSTGYKVPVGAVRVVNGKTGVYVLDGVTVRFCRIRTVYKSDAFYVVATEPKPEQDEEKSEDNKDNPKEETERWLKFHDSLIIEGKGLYDGRIIG